MSVLDEIQRYRWLALRAAVLGLATFELLRPSVDFVAYGIDRLVFLKVAPPVRVSLVHYRVWEIYRAILDCLAAAGAGWVVAYIDLPRRSIGIFVFVALLALSLLVPILASGRGYYLTDIVTVVAIAVSPLIGRVGRNGSGFDISSD